MSGLQAAAQNEFGRAAADVHHQHFAAVRRKGVHHARVNQTRFLAPRNHFDGKAQRGFGLRQEFGNIFGNAERVGGHGADVFGRKAAQTFAKLRQAFQGAAAAGFVQHFVVVQTARQAHHVLDIFDDLRMALMVLADLQAETVRPQIHRSQHGKVAHNLSIEKVQAAFYAPPTVRTAISATRAALSGMASVRAFTAHSRHCSRVRLPRICARLSAFSWFCGSSRPACAPTR